MSSVFGVMECPFQDGSGVFKGEEVREKQVMRIDSETAHRDVWRDSEARENGTHSLCEEAA